MREEQRESKRETAIHAAFGSANRKRLLATYFSTYPNPDAANAWKHLYRLLLWIDATTGLAHCYESDKSQPGKNWYERSLAFHAWVSAFLDVPPTELAEGVDWLFKNATIDLVRQILRRQASLIARARKQRAPYETKGLPEPGEDPELVQIIRDSLGEYLPNDPPKSKWREIVQRVRQHVTVENKRKNLVGEGFEDVLETLISHIVPAGSVTATTRRLLQTIPGFSNARVGEKPNKVDLAVLNDANLRMLITAKWSIRADREKQFQSEFASYVAAKSDNRPFDYVLVTNEFDPARLLRACESMAANTTMFTSVVHINTQGLLATYGPSPEASMAKVVELVGSGRLIDLETWIRKLHRA